jgi:hypothetical protein
MKIYKKNISLIALVAIMVIPLGCTKNFLNKTNTFQSEDEATFQKPGNVVALVNSIYDGYQNSDLLKKSMWYYSNFQTHDFFNYGADVVWNNYQINSDFGALRVFWDNAYINIARANRAFVIIEKAKAKGVLTAELADRLMGEAYFLRGMTYYYLAGSFGGVPIELNPDTDGLKARNTEKEVFEQVVFDMKKAETLLLSKKTLAKEDLGRATKGAAYAYEGSAQMWLKNYAGALAAFNNVELTSNHKLLSDFAQVHEFDNQNNEESLFEIQFVVSGSQTWDGGWQNGGEIAWIDDFSWPEEVSNFGYDYANPGLWYSYQDGDKRKLLTVIGPGDENVSPGIVSKLGGIKGYEVVQERFKAGNIRYKADDGTIINTCGTRGVAATRTTPEIKPRPWYGVSDENRSGYYCSKKWRDYTLTGGNGKQVIFGSQNQILMRYAEVLLSRAECKVRTNDVAGAMADLKLVRDRAWGGTAPAVMKDGLKWDGTASSPILDPLQMVLSEYRHELTGEYSLFYLLRRAGPGVAAAFIKEAYGTDATTTPQPAKVGPTADGKEHGVYRTSLPAGRDLLPIPQRARALNPNLTQNPGY